MAYFTYKKLCGISAACEGESFRIYFTYDDDQFTTLLNKDLSPAHNKIMKMSGGFVMIRSEFGKALIKAITHDKFVFLKAKTDRILQTREDNVIEKQKEAGPLLYLALGEFIKMYEAALAGEEFDEKTCYANAKAAMDQAS